MVSKKWTARVQSMDTTPEKTTRTALEEQITVLLCLFRQYRWPKETAAVSGLSEKTVRRYYRVFELAARGLDATRIAAEPIDLSVDRIRVVLRLMAETADDYGSGSASLIAHHRTALLECAANACHKADAAMDVSVYPPLAGSWPKPLEGDLESAPRFRFESDPLWPCLAEHLERLEVGGKLDAVRSAAWAYREGARILEGHAFNEIARTEETESLVPFQVQSAIDLVRRPNTEIIEFKVESGDGRSVVRGGALRLALEDRSQAQDLVAELNSIPGEVVASGIGLRFVRATVALQTAMGVVARSLADTDLVRQTLAETSCQRCRRLGRTRLMSGGPVQPV